MCRRQLGRDTGRRITGRDSHRDSRTALNSSRRTCRRDLDQVETTTAEGLWIFVGVPHGAQQRNIICSGSPGARAAQPPEATRISARRNWVQQVEHRPARELVSAGTIAHRCRSA
jgi:hypothetical protein